MSEQGKEPEFEQLRNTLYRKVTKGKRRLTRSRLLVYRVAVFIGYWLGRALWASCRIQPALGFERARAAVREHRSVIPAFWHQHMLFAVRALIDLRPDGLELGFLISPSVDGVVPAMLAKRIGAHVIRGSSTHTGARALRDFYETVVKQQLSPGITPDGPRGPVHEFKPGALLLAQLTGKPILPVSIAASHEWRFRTWDRFELPRPFSRVMIAFGEPVKVPRGLTPDGMVQFQAEMGTALDRLNEEAHAALRSRAPD
jgi:lysophospholipid acyltransferase (LPLAT)-like uncharacterized protein